MPPKKKSILSVPPIHLEDIPNIGKSIANDLRGLGIRTPTQLATQDPLKLYNDLEVVTGHRHDPCILYTLMAARRFLQDGKPVPWWKYTEEGKSILAAEARKAPRRKT